jgi:error-prone DNA polymerase
VEVREVSIEQSFWDSSLEPASEQCGVRSAAVGAKKAIRLGFRLVKGMGEASSKAIEAARAVRPFVSLDDVIRRADLRKDEVEALAEAGAFESLERGRRQALWKARAPRTEGLFAELDVAEPRVALPPLHVKETLLLDYSRTGLSVNDHPMRHLRAALTSRNVLTAAELGRAPQGKVVLVAGLVLTRQRPGTASGVVFITLEDETGTMNLVLYSGIFDAFYLPARHAALLLARGKVEREVTAPRPGEVGKATPVIHVLVEHLERLDVGRVESRSRDFH